MSADYLLNEVAKIKRQNDEIARLRRENYNIFSLLRKEHDEENLHSAFIADLLNPRGSHEMGAVFAKRFFSAIEKSEVTVDGGTYVEAERLLPQGRADIYLRTPSHEVIIENKIWAADQPEQLLRYYNYLNAARRESGDYLLIYLTLHGDEATDISIQSPQGKALKADRDYTLLSYEDHIVEWLRACRNLAIDHPPLRETIGQYINLIKKLTKQLTNDQMEADLRQQILNNLDAAELISANLRPAKRALVNKFVDILVRKLADTLGNEWSIKFSGTAADLTSVGVRYAKLKLRPRSSSWPEDLHVVVEGQSNMVDGPTIFGIYYIREETRAYVTAKNTLNATAFMQRHSRNNQWWLASTTLIDFSDTDTLKRLNNVGELMLAEEAASKVASLSTGCLNAYADQS